jgi:hypothetical protein
MRGPSLETDLAQDVDKRRAPVNTPMKYRIP